MNPRTLATRTIGTVLSWILLPIGTLIARAIHEWDD